MNKRVIQMATKRPTKLDLRTELRRFVAEHPDGWGHEEWLGLLATLQEQGHAVKDADEVGRMVERERLAAVLGKVEQVGPARVKAITDRYESLWDLRSADSVGLSETAKIPLALAERIKSAV